MEDSDFFFVSPSRKTNTNRAETISHLPIYIYHESITNKALFSSTYNNIPDQIISFGEFYGSLHHFDHSTVSLHNPSSTLRICCKKLNCVSVFCCIPDLKRRVGRHGEGWCYLRDKKIIYDQKKFHKMQH